MINPKDIPNMTYDEAEAALRMCSEQRKLIATLSRQVQTRMDELAAEQKAMKMVEEMSPSERYAVAKLVDSASE